MPLFCEPLESRELLSVSVSWGVEASALGNVAWSGIGNENTGNLPTSYGLDTVNQLDAAGADFPAPENKSFAPFSSQGSVAYDGALAEGSVTGQYAASSQPDTYYDGNDVYTIETSGDFSAHSAYSGRPRDASVNAYYQVVMSIFITVTDTPVTVRVSGSPRLVGVPPGEGYFQG